MSAVAISVPIVDGAARLSAIPVSASNLPTSTTPGFAGGGFERLGELDGGNAEIAVADRLVELGDHLADWL